MVDLGLLATDPDLVITVTWDRDPDNTQALVGVPVLCVDLNYYKEGIAFLGDVLGKESKAIEFTDYYDQKMGYIKSKLGDLTKPEKVRTYIAGGGGRLTTYGAESTWHFEIEDAMGINVAVELVGGGHHNVGMEQVLTWNPEVIIVDKSCPDSVEDILTDPAWETISAVANNQVYLAPDGFLDTFGRPHMESILSRLWIAEKLYPEEIDLDIVETAKDFYSTFYGLDLTSEEIKDILNIQ